MSESYKSGRVKFKKGAQEKFMTSVSELLSVKQIAELCGRSERTIRDWRKGRFLMEHGSVCALSKKTKVPVPKDVEVLDRYWYTHDGGKLGGVAIMKKYGKVGGDPEFREKRWRLWWNYEGRYKENPILSRHSVKMPPFSVKLAEFVGIMLGDGGITEYQLRVTLHRYDDKEYAEYVTSLIENLFRVPVARYVSKYDKSVDLVVSRKALVEFCVNRLGLVRGNKIKSHIDIPDWVKKRRTYAIACVRGLVDTDGSVFTHRYIVNGKEYRYKKLAFTSYSKPLRLSVFSVLEGLELQPRYARKGDVRIDSMKDMETYFNIIGSHNAKHLRRYQK